MEGGVRLSRHEKSAVSVVAAAACALWLAPACKKSRSAEPGPEVAPAVDDTAAPAASKAPSGAPPGPTGTISGTVILTGKAPEMPLLQRGADPFCAREEMHAEAVLAGDGGGLANALVRVAPGAVKGWVPSSPVVVDQVDCMYRPRVQGGVRGQTLEVRNSDKTTHNVNARKLPWGERRDTDTIFNRAQIAGAPPITDPIGEDEILKLKCDVHGWMQGFVVVSDNPYFGTSGKDGHFTIERAPAGTYELQVWHEYYGIKTQSVTVAEGKSAEVHFTYDAEKDRPAQTGAR